MSQTRAGEQAKAAAVAEAEKGLLDRIIDNVKGEVGRAGGARGKDSAARAKDAEERAKESKEAEEQARDLVRAYVMCLRGKQATFDKNLPTTINAMVKEIDEQISAKLNEVMHHPDFLQLEGSWRGLSYLTANTHLSATLKIKVLPVRKEELTRDFSRNTEQTKLYTALHQETYNVAGGEPFGALIGDYEWGAPAGRRRNPDRHHPHRPQLLHPLPVGGIAGNDRPEQLGEARSERRLQHAGRGAALRQVAFVP